MSSTRLRTRSGSGRVDGCGVLLVVLAVVHAAPVPAEVPDPFDAIPDLQAQVDAVNEGKLAFLPRDSAPTAHTHRNRIEITSASLAEGWVRLAQCHRNLDAVPAAQIVYNPGQIRHLAITRVDNIGQAWVDGHRVEVRDVQPAAELCIEGESRALRGLGEGVYRLRNGPYMRKFLDGYYPMRVLLDIGYPASTLSLVGHSPERQEGFEVEAEPGRIHAAAVFEGRLYTCFDFCAVAEGECWVPEVPCEP